MPGTVAKTAGPGPRRMPTTVGRSGSGIPACTAAGTTRAGNRSSSLDLLMLETTAVPTVPPRARPAATTAVTVAMSSGLDTIKRVHRTISEAGNEQRRDTTHGAQSCTTAIKSTNGAANPIPATASPPMSSASPALPGLAWENIMTLQFEELSIRLSTRAGVISTTHAIRNNVKPAIKGRFMSFVRATYTLMPRHDKKPHAVKINDRQPTNRASVVYPCARISCGMYAATPLK